MSSLDAILSDLYWTKEKRNELDERLKDMDKTWMYNRNVEEVVCKEWQPLLQSFIENVDDYLWDEPRLRRDFKVTYIKDKYSRLRMEYQGGDDYLHSLIANIEDLSFYMIPKKLRY